MCISNFIHVKSVLYTMMTECRFLVQLTVLTVNIIFVYHAKSAWMSEFLCKVIILVIVVMSYIYSLKTSAQAGQMFVASAC